MAHILLFISVICLRFLYYLTKNGYIVISIIVPVNKKNINSSALILGQSGWFITSSSTALQKVCQYGCREGSSGAFWPVPDYPLGIVGMCQGAAELGGVGCEVPSLHDCAGGVQAICNGVSLSESVHISF